jgi:hypothetical protein
VDNKRVIAWDDFLDFFIEQSAALRRDQQFHDYYQMRSDYELMQHHKDFLTVVSAEQVDQAHHRALMLILPWFLMYLCSARGS